MRPVLRGRLHCGGISFFRFVHNGVQQFAGADAERPRKRNQHIHIGDAVPALQYGDETLAGFAVVSKLLLGQPRGIPVAPEKTPGIK